MTRLCSLHYEEENLATCPVLCLRIPLDKGLITPLLACKSSTPCDGSELNVTPILAMTGRLQGLSSAHALRCTLYFGWLSSYWPAPSSAPAMKMRQIRRALGMHVPLTPCKAQANCTTLKASARQNGLVLGLFPPAGSSSGVVYKQMQLLGLDQQQLRCILRGRCCA